MTDEGMINIWVNLKEQVPDLHKDYAREVKEFATDPEGGADCPPLSIVIFIVGSRGEYGTRLCYNAKNQVMCSHICH